MSAMTKWLLAGAAIATSAAVGLSFGVSASPDPQGSLPQPTATYYMQADHATYSSLDGLKADASDIVVATVVSHVVDPGTSLGVDGAGDPLPAMPSTIYTATVTESIKGPLAAGASIAVILSGGTNEEGAFILDGGPVMEDGSSYMMFLLQQDGNYYPLAGGAAMGTKQADGSYALPSEVSGASAPLVVSVPSSPGPTPDPVKPRSEQTAVVKLPKKIAFKGKTTLLKGYVVTNAGQRVSAKVMWKPKGKKYAAVKKGKMGKLTIVTKGKKKLKVTLTLAAPQTADHNAYTYTKTWKVKKKK